MAIRDRVTVKTKDGTVTWLVVRKMGGKISIEWPKRITDQWFRAVILDKNGDETNEEVRVPADQVSYVVVDEEPKENDKKKR